MQRIRIVVTYVMLWTKFGLNGAKKVKFRFRGEIFVF